MVVKAVAPKPLMNGSSEPAVDSSYLMQYKELIREQDRRLEELSQTVERLTQEKHYMQMKLEECTGTLAQLRDQNMLLKAQANTSLGPVPELEEARVGLEHWRAECEHKDAIIESLQSNISADTHIDDLEARIHELYLEMGEKDLELERLKKSTTSHQHQLHCHLHHHLVPLTSKFQTSCREILVHNQVDDDAEADLEEVN
nr:unnamed protein product [Timema californicum]